MAAGDKNARVDAIRDLIAGKHLKKREKTVDGEDSSNLQKMSKLTLGKPPSVDESIKKVSYGSLAQEIQSIQETTNKSIENISSSILSESRKINHLSTLMRNPQKEVRDSGNVNILKKELHDLRLEAKSEASKAVVLQKKIKKVEEKRAGFQAELDAIYSEMQKNEDLVYALNLNLSEVTDEMDLVNSQVSENEISSDDIQLNIDSIKSEMKNLNKIMRQLTSKIKKSKNRIKEIPKLTLKLESKISTNITQISSFEQKSLLLDQQLGEARQQLEWAIGEQRIVSKEYDRLVSQKDEILYFFNIFDEFDNLVDEKSSLNNEIIRLKLEYERAKQDVKTHNNQMLDFEIKISETEQEIEKIKREILDKNSELRKIQGKYTIFAEVDDAAKALLEIENTLSDSLVENTEFSEKIRDTAKRRIGGQQILKDLVTKENQLKIKLTAVLNEKRRLEQELSEISSTSSAPAEKLIIELPNALRDAIKRETERISNVQKTIKSLEIEQEKLEVQQKKLIQKREQDTKIRLVREKQLLYLKNKLIDSGYTDVQRASVKKELDSLQIIIRDLENKVNSLQGERKHLQGSLLRSKRKHKQLTQQVIRAENDVETKYVKLHHISERMASLRERKIKIWAKDTSILRLIYPLKERMEGFLDEKTKVRADLEDIERLVKKAESDMQISEKALNSARIEQSSIEQKYIQIQSKIHSLQKENNSLTADCDGLNRELSDEIESLPIDESQQQSTLSDLDTLESKVEEENRRKKNYLKEIRKFSSHQKKIQKTVEKHLADTDILKAKIHSLTKKEKIIHDKIERETTYIIKYLDERTELQNNLDEYKKKESLLEDEIKVFEGIYNGK